MTHELYTHILIDKETKARIKASAALRGRSMTSLVRDWSVRLMHTDKGRKNGTTSEERIEGHVGDSKCHDGDGGLAGS